MNYPESTQSRKMCVRVLGDAEEAVVVNAGALQLRRRAADVKAASKFQLLGVRLAVRVERRQRTCRRSQTRVAQPREVGCFEGRIVERGARRREGAVCDLNPVPVTV